MIRLLAALAAVMLSGCSLFFGSGDDRDEHVNDRNPGRCYADFLDKKFDEAFVSCSGIDDPEVLYDVAWMYSRGKGTDRNLPKARVLMQKAAQGGYTEAMQELGLMYDSGIGGKQDYEKAFFWYSRAAEHNSVAAMNSLASLYYCGDGVKQDFNRSFFWSEKAASGGSAEGMFNMGRLLESGRIADPAVREKDPDYWYRRAAELKYPEAVFTVARKSYEKNGSPGDLSEIKRAARLGSSAAALYIGKLTEKREGSGSVDAYCWYDFAVVLGNTEAAELKNQIVLGWDKSKLLEAEEQCGN